MSITVFLVFLAACGAAGATGALFKPGAWYRGLQKPGFTPPDWMFPLAWTTIYVLSAIAAARVAPLAGNALAMAFWALQIALNTLWSPVFFGLHRPRAGLVIVAALWLAVAGTCASFLALDTWAGIMIGPYLIWVTLAAALNAAIVRLNPDERGQG